MICLVTQRCQLIFNRLIFNINTLMAKLLFKAILLASVLSLFDTSEVYAQCKSGIEYRAGNVWADGERLKKPELKMMFSEQDYARFISGRRLMVSGATLTGIGGTFVAVNGALMIYYANFPTDPCCPQVNMSYVFCAGNVILGSAMLLAGVPCLCVGINRMQKTVGHYNETQLTLGPTSSGFGLALKF